MKNNKLLKYFKTQEQFDAQSIYVEQGSTEDTYIDQNGDQQWGDPDIYPEHICFIEDTKTIFTHNTKYICSSYKSGSCGCGIKETTVFDILKFYNDTTKTFNESYINDNGDEILLSDENGYLLATDILQEMINNEIVFAGVANKHNISINNLNDKIIQVEEQINNTDSSINNLNDKIIQVEEQINNTDSAELLVNVIYDELCNLVNTNSLLPGQKYRITDYETTTLQLDTMSAGHKFDIIVTALTENTLSENASACYHDEINIIPEFYHPLGFDGYDVIFERIEDPIEINGKEGYTCYIDNMHENILYFDFNDSSKVKYNNGNIIFYPSYYIAPEYGVTEITDVSNIPFSDDFHMPNIELNFQIDDNISYEIKQMFNNNYFKNIGVNLSAWELKYCLNNDPNKFAWADEENGKGVIYFLKDEHNNECSYDFKNIQFKRWAITDITSNKLTSDNVNDLKNIYCKAQNNGKYYAAKDIYGNWAMYSDNTEWIVDEDDYTWYYTFQGLSSEDRETISEQYDVSTKVNKLTDECLQQLELDWSGYNIQDMCKENQIQSAYYELFCDDEYFKGRMVLNNIVFINGLSYCYYIEDEGYWLYEMNHCYGNKFGIECKNNTFGNGCYNNTFINDFHDNTFGNDCYDNTFGNYCWSNIFGNSFTHNILGNYCWSNIFGNNCYRNTFENSCIYNIFGKQLQDNTFETYCYYNTFGNNCQCNTFGNNCQGNTFGKQLQDNTFGNKCMYNIFGNNCQGNTFGNKCSYNTFRTGCIKYCRFGDGVQYCTISGYSIKTNYYIYNIVVLNGTKGKSAQQLLELNQNNIFNTHNFKRDIDLVPQIVCGFSVDENNGITYVTKYYMNN